MPTDAMRALASDSRLRRWLQGDAPPERGTVVLGHRRVYIVPTRAGCRGDRLSVRKEYSMPLFEVETDAHIIITWAADENAAKNVVREAYPSDKVIRLTKRPRDTWVISKGALGLTNTKLDVCTVARDCLAKAAGDKVHAIRLYMHETGTDLDHARKVIESNMVMGW